MPILIRDFEADAVLNSRLAMHAALIEITYLVKIVINKLPPLILVLRL